MRAKAGLALNDTALSLSFGPAIGKFDASIGDISANFTDTAKLSGNVKGWVYGLGVEHTFKKVLIGFDWSHYVFQDKTANWVDQFGVPEVDCCTPSSTLYHKAKFSETVDIARVTVSYKF